MRPHPTHDVLLVDPDLEMRACRAFYLQMRGFRVVGTRAADDTLRQLRAGFRPCIVVADPRTTGDVAWKLVDYLRTDSVLVTVPLVLVTHDFGEAMGSEWHGVVECIAKPVTPQSLVAAIERHCGRRSEASGAPSVDNWRRPHGVPVQRRQTTSPVMRPSRKSTPPLLRRRA